MMVAVQNSIDTYIALLGEDEVGKKQREVLKFISTHENCTYNEISRIMGMHHNTVTARIKELRDMGYIKKSGTVTDPLTKKPNATYRLRKPDEAPDVIERKFTHPTVPSALVPMLKYLASPEHPKYPRSVGMFCGDPEMDIWYAPKPISKGCTLKFNAEQNIITFNTARNDIVLTEIKAVEEDTAHQTLIMSNRHYQVKFDIE